MGFHSPECRRRPLHSGDPKTANSKSLLLAGLRTEDFTWTCDFVYDACANSQQVECLTTDVTGAIGSGRAVEVLARPVASVEPRSICVPTTAPSSCLGRYRAGLQMNRPISP
jgi:hypothetical protein